MDLAKRQAVQNALEAARAKHSLLAIKRTDGRSSLVGLDLTCHETHIAATDQDGRPVDIAYSEIETVTCA